MKLQVPDGANAAYTAGPGGRRGYLVYSQGDALMARPFDAAKLEAEGEPFTAAQQPALFGVAPGAAFSVSNNGVLAYRTSSGGQEGHLVWYDRGGKRLGNVGEPAIYSNPALSPDGKRLAVGITDPQTRMRDIWIFDLVRGTRSRFTFDPADDFNPVWSPDGTRIAFSSTRKGHRDVYVKTANGTGQDELLFESELAKSVEDWSPDGRYIVFNTGMGHDLWSLPFSGENASQKPTAFLQAQFGQDQAQVSPDGRRASGRFQPPAVLSRGGEATGRRSSFRPTPGLWRWR